MSDPLSKDFTPWFVEFFALACAFGCIDSIREHSPYSQCASFAVASLLLAVTGFKWSWIKTRVTKLFTSRELRAALAENADLKKQLAERTDKSLPSTEALKAEIEQLQADSVSLAVGGKMVAGPAAFEEQRKTQMLAEILSPLQIEALTLARELRDFYAAHPFPDLPDPDFEMEQESLRRLIDTRADKQAKWRQKLLHAYANRGFGPRITALMHRLGEDFEYPVSNPKVAEDLRVPMKDTIPILAQHMEMLAIWINRKERGEVDLLHPKS